MVELEGRDKVSYWENTQNCAPCFLPNLDPTQDPALQRYQRNLQCKVCGSPDDQRISCSVTNVEQGITLCA